MARGVSYELTGLRDLTAVLDRASATIRAAIVTVQRETAFAIADRARRNAPRDRGDLIHAISAQGKDLNWRVGVLDVRLSSRGGRNSAHLNPSVYGTFIEYGTVNYPRHPFMGPAVDAERRRYEERLNTAARGLTTAFGVAA
jgi:HK97 gp10 family phage protein